MSKNCQQKHTQTWQSSDNVVTLKLKILIIRSSVDKLATHTTENLLQGRWHWFVWLSTGIESNKAPHRKKIKDVHCTTINSPFNYFIKWPSEGLSDCLAWIQPEVKQSGRLWELATSTATPLSIGTHWGTDDVCVCVRACGFWWWRWLQLLGCLCRRQLEVDVATAEPRDNRDSVLGHTHKPHKMATLSLSYGSSNHKLIENFMKCWP